MTDREWSFHRPNGFRAELRPYIECPNCGRYKLTTVRVIQTRLFAQSTKTEYDKCRNCKFTGDKETTSL